MQIPQLNLQKVKTDLKDGFSQLAKGGFQKIFSQIDQASIRNEVDRMGIDKFINHCALLAAGSGAITGFGGLTTLLVGMPFDFINLLTQQFRVTLAIAYHNTGNSKLRFTDFFKILASSLKVDTGMTMSKKVMQEVAEKLMVLIGSKTARRLVPVVGAVIGGSTNYFFIKRMAESVKRTHASAKVIKI
jgi:hypothetical protein